MSERLHPPETSQRARRHRGRARVVTTGQARGHTLVESLVAIALLAVLAAMAVPSLRGFLLRRQLDGASAQLQADLHLLRSTSVARNLALRLTLLSSAGGTCYLVHSGDVAQCDCRYGPATEAQGRCDGSAELLRAQAWPSAGSSLVVRANVASMRVDPRHGTVSPTGSIDLQVGDGPVLRHVVNILGRVRLCTPAAAIGGIAAC
ncbi:MAG: GspH/FimT family protein [Leptothrix sp. (in: b-proteobacteria)]